MVLTPEYSQNSAVPLNDEKIFDCFCYFRRRKWMRRQRADTSEEVGVMFSLQCLCVCPGLIKATANMTPFRDSYLIGSDKLVCSPFIILLVKVVTLRRSSGRGPSIWKNAKLLLHPTSFSKWCVWLCYSSWNGTSVSNTI